MVIRIFWPLDCQSENGYTSYIDADLRRNHAPSGGLEGRVFELRYFGGMSVEEAAEALKVSPATVARDWRMAKAWLRRAIAPGPQHAT